MNVLNYPTRENGLTHSPSGLKQMTNAALLEVFDSLKCGDKVRIAFSGGFACTGKEPITVKVGRRSYSKKYKTHKIRLGKVDRSFGLFLYKRAPIGRECRAKKIKYHWVMAILDAFFIISRRL